MPERFEIFFERIYSFRGFLRVFDRIFDAKQLSKKCHMQSIVKIDFGFNARSSGSLTLTFAKTGRLCFVFIVKTKLWHGAVVKCAAWYMIYLPARRDIAFNFSRTIGVKGFGGHPSHLLQGLLIWGKIDTR